MPFVSQPRGQPAHWNESRFLTNHVPVPEEDTCSRTESPGRVKELFLPLWVCRDPAPFPQILSGPPAEGAHAPPADLAGPAPSSPRPPVGGDVTISFVKIPQRHLPTYSTCLSALVAQWRGSLGADVPPTPGQVGRAETRGSWDNSSVPSRLSSGLLLR